MSIPASALAEGVPNRYYGSAMVASIEHDPADLTFEEFASLNDVCFPHEPVSEASFANRSSPHMWTVRVNGLLVGYSSMSRSSKAPHIKRIGIHPDFRSRGFAKRLMKRMLSLAAEESVCEVRLLVEQDNDAAIGLYRSFNFEVTGESVQFSSVVRSSGSEAHRAVPIDEYDWPRDRLHLPESLQMLAKRHNPPHSLVLLFLEEETPIGYALFCPDYPGCSPFVLLRDSVAVEQVVGLLNDYALPGKRNVKITTADSKAIATFTQAGTHVNYRLFEMTKRLTSSDE